MEVRYQSIVEANKSITYTNVKGKEYAEVAQKVQAFRSLIPGGFITSDIIKFEPGIVYMKAEAGYYENDHRVVLATGHAFERQDASNVNKTSFIENCETSAVGRALSFIGLGSVSSVSSVEELKNAIATQNAIAQGIIPEPGKPVSKPANKETPAKPAEVTQAAKLPEAPAEPKNPILEYLASEREALRIERDVTKAENNAIWKAQLAALLNAKLVPDKPLAEFTSEEAKTLIGLMYSKFTPTGTVIKDDGAVA